MCRQTFDFALAVSRQTDSSAATRRLETKKVFVMPGAHSSLITIVNIVSRAARRPSCLPHRHAARFATTRVTLLLFRFHCRSLVPPSSLVRTKGGAGGDNLAASVPAENFPTWQRKAGIRDTGCVAMVVVCVAHLCALTPATVGRSTRSVLPHCVVTS
ncbi:hypothetical protein E2C01_004215 [Portunus trituberculatus]|uniref:Uncharacterized protein n=1 Tax=Portunus trituberculatus TaxID=210409 RepID=A0A5B7CQ04_PORTR|nr:hypothetical protein [Portunus trituberculatus]